MKKRSLTNNAAEIIKECKNALGNHENGNLSFALRAFSTPYLKEKEDVISAIKLVKNIDGVCDKKNVQLFNFLVNNYQEKSPILLRNMLDKDGNITNLTKQFVSKTYSFEKGKSIKHAERVKYILDILSLSKISDREEILGFILNNQVLFEACPPITNYIDTSGNINLNYLKQYLELCSIDDKYKFFNLDSHIYNSENKEIVDKNIEQVKRYLERKYTNKDLLLLSKCDNFKEGEEISQEFTDFIFSLGNMFKCADNYRAYPFIDTSINSSKYANGKVNWNLAIIFQKFGYEYVTRLKEINSDAVNTIKQIIQKSGEMCKDKKGLFDFKKVAIVKGDLEYIKNHFPLEVSDKYINEKYIIMQEKF